MKVEQSRVDNCKTAEYMKQIYKYLYLIGWPNFWHTEHDLPPIVKNYHSVASKFLDIFGFILVVMEVFAFFTQNDLSAKQKSDRLLLSFSHPILATFGIIVTYYQEKIRAFTTTLTVDLKKHYNDRDIEVEMIKKARRYSTAYCFLCGSSLAFYGFDGLMQCLIDKNASFVTVVTAWPDVKDQSSSASYFRMIAYIQWWIFMTRVSGIYVMLISILVCLEYQFKNLQSFFYNLDNVFKNDELSLNEKEKQYERGLKLGIEMHSRTLWCKSECELSYMGVLSGQIVINGTVIILLLSQMLNSERTFASVAATLCTLSAMLISTGFFMWTAGDVTVEAADLATAMFSSGWQNCHEGSSVRVRKLLAVAMTQAQVPVTFQAFGNIELSYASYVSIVKSSYSTFSVLY